MRAAAAAYPAAKSAIAAGDPLFLAQLDAAATALAMVSAQVDIAATEWAIKARDGTVLADAALKGILPLAKSARLQLIVRNTGPGAVALAAGRSLIDGKGRLYRVEGSASATPGALTTITAVQLSSRTQTQTVPVSAPFYAFEVLPGDDDVHLVGLEIEDDDGPYTYTYTPEFCNVNAGDRVFHAETDEYRRLFVRFGADGIVGTQLASGTVLTLTVSECRGLVELEAGAALSFEYIGSTAEGYLTFTLDEILDTGSDPHDIESLRVMSRYQALHDENAVYRGDFDFLLRKHLGVNLQFLSVWNEQVEEQARGANTDNINRLFVSASVNGQLTAVTQALAQEVVARADDGYRFTFIAPTEVEVPLVIDASVASVHDVGDVEAQIRSAILAAYGRGTKAASRGLIKAWRNRDIHDLLKASVDALQDTVSDFKATLGSPMGTQYPENWQYIADGSMTVTVTRVQDATGLWTV